MAINPEATPGRAGLRRSTLLRALAVNLGALGGRTALCADRAVRSIAAQQRWMDAARA